jgi:hypothetical protein
VATSGSAIAARFVKGSKFVQAGGSMSFEAAIIRPLADIGLANSSRRLFRRRHAL